MKWPIVNVALAVAAASCSAAMRPQPVNMMAGIDVVELSAADASKQMAAGTLTSRALTAAYLNRIAALDKNGPAINAIIELNPSALSDADALDRERQAGHVRGSLHGIPILIKDNIDVAGMANSAGSLALESYRPAADAFLVKQLRTAGVVILGKTNLSEWANFRSTHSTSGWSSRGGQTKNPYALDRNPCGSSSGTGAAISASFAGIGIGTETDGSIICPSAVTGLVGLKPTVGLVSRDGIIPISATQDTAGPMGRSVTDVALLLSAIADGNEDYSRDLSPDALRGKRFGLLRKTMGFHADVDAAVESAVAKMKAAGAEVVDVEIKTQGQWDAPEMEVLLYEFKDGLNRFLSQRRTQMHSLQELIAWNNANAARVMPHFKQELFERAQAKGPLTDPAYRKAKDDARRLAKTEGIDAVLAASKLDALIAPSTSPAWLTDYVLGDHYIGGGYGVAAVAGTPSITIPIGLSHGLPIGVTLMTSEYTEGALLRYAFALEQLTRSRTAPLFAPGVQ